MEFNFVFSVGVLAECGRIPVIGGAEPSLENTVCHKVSLLWLARTSMLPARAEFSELFRLLLSTLFL